MDVDGLSGQQGDEKEVLLEDSLSAGASLTRAEGHSHALVRYTPLGFIHLGLSMTHPHLPGGLASCTCVVTWIHPVVSYTENPRDDCSFVLWWG